MIAFSLSRAFPFQLLDKCSFFFFLLFFRPGLCEETFRFPLRIFRVSGSPGFDLPPFVAGLGEHAFPFSFSRRKRSREIESLS